MDTKSEAPVLGAIASLTSDDMSGFLERQRWFDGKAAAPTAVRVASAVVMPWGDGAYAIARIAVAADGAERSYQLPLALHDRMFDLPRTAVLAESPDSVNLLFDAVYDEDFRLGLARALTASSPATGPTGARWLVEPIAPETIPKEPRTTRLVSAEQSNTSIVVDESVIIKLFRVLADGEQPDAEMATFLSGGARFPNTPAILATMRFEESGLSAVSGIVQPYLAHSTDAWSYALERGRPYFAAAEDQEKTNDFAIDAARLGEITRRMHEALAGDASDPSFAPEPVTVDDLRRWQERTRQTLRDSLALLQRQLAESRVPKSRVAESEALVRRSDDYSAWADSLVADLEGDLGMRIRVHGDYHLGQVLRTHEGELMVIDFEGEPSKTLAERREKSSPLRDVAGMLRSIDYAAATLAASVEKSVDMPTRELRAGRWERDVRAAYLTAYLSATAGGGARILPEARATVDRLIALFETEKAFYELAYELNTRPEWAWIPMRGIAKLRAR